MADISVDTTAQGYRRHLTRFRELKSFYGPILKLYFQLPEDKKQAWRQRDPILREILQFSNRIQQEKGLE